MDNLEWLENVKKADGDVDEAIEKAKKGLFVDDKAIAKVILDYRKLRALEIIAEELCLLEEIYKKEISLKYKVDIVDGQTLHWKKNKYVGM